jgi:hypothetical protein
MCKLEGFAYTNREGGPKDHKLSAHRRTRPHQNKKIHYKLLLLYKSMYIY